MRVIDFYSINNLKQVPMSYRTDIGIFSGGIVEYDIKAAGLNILLVNLDKLDLPDDIKDYIKNEIPNMEKKKRVVELGLIHREYKFLNEFVNDWLRWLVLSFIRENFIGNYDIISIKRDAVFIRDVPIEKTTFNGIEFVKKNVYDFFIQFSLGKNKRVEVYSKGDGSADIKGINEYESFIAWCVDKVKRIYRNPNRDTRIKLLEKFENDLLFGDKFKNKSMLKYLENNGKIKLKAQYSIDVKAFETDDKLFDMIDTEYYYEQFASPILKVLINEII
jgi:hypothetical protein